MKSEYIPLGKEHLQQTWLRSVPALTPALTPFHPGPPPWSLSQVHSVLCRPAIQSPDWVLCLKCPVVGAEDSVKGTMRVQWDGKDACHPAWWLQFSLQDPQEGRRELTLSKCVLWCPGAWKSNEAQVLRGSMGCGRNQLWYMTNSWKDTILFTF